MKILFIHQNFPGQFIHLAAALAKDSRNRVVALGMNDRPVPKGVEFRRYSLLRPAESSTHPLLREQESHVLRAEACASAAFQLKQGGFEPDIIVAHPGWGEALLIKDVFPNARIVIYCEYFYALEGQDVGFDPEDPPLSFQQKAKLRLKNTTNLLSLQIADAAISPTVWQRSTYPEWARSKIEVIHEGIDTERLTYQPAASLRWRRLDKEHQIAVGDEVFTYVARNLEPVRGFHTFMRALPNILRQRPHAQAVIVGGDEVSYGASPVAGTWRQELLNEIAAHTDLNRIHFLGKIAGSDYCKLLSISRVHTYLTTPFVLSWSMLEAVLSGVHVIASDTAPVREFAHYDNLELTNFFDHEALSKKVIYQLSREDSHRVKHANAGALSLTETVSAQIKLIKNLLA